MAHKKKSTVMVMNVIMAKLHLVVLVSSTMIQHAQWQGTITVTFNVCY